MKYEKIQAPKGVSEYAPPLSAAFEWVRESLIAPAKLAGYQLMELPVFEDTSLFSRGVGESTDVVSKEMYTFEDRGGRSITLRPEGTAGVMRAVIEKGLDRGQLPVKVWYSGAFFRAERPQAGRYRQFYQVGIEAIGLDDPAIDAEVIAIADQGFKSLGLKNYRLEITSLGDAQSRAAHRVDLLKFISKLDLDEATATRAAINPLRLFDDKRPEMKAAMAGAPLLLDYLSEDKVLVRNPELVAVVAMTASWRSLVDRRSLESDLDLVLIAHFLLHKQKEFLLKINSPQISSLFLSAKARRAHP